MTPELLAPCGSPEALEAALRAGCDAVYLGGEHFSARQNAKNFTRGQLREAVERCHRRGVKVYQAINTVITDSELSECMDAVHAACELGVDGLITQDLALVAVARECCPELPIHASTQMTLHTREGVLLAREMGFSRAVASRELPEEVLRELCSLPIEIEVFVHGALCMSVSGQCFMSAVIGSRSANRGLCAQACRLPASPISGRREDHALSLKDMSLIPQLAKLREMGAASLKIEGRMKRPEYVAAAVRAARDSLEGREPQMEQLKNVFSRSGFTDGYFTGRRGREMFGTRTREDAMAAADELPKLHELYRSLEKRADVRFEIKIRAGEPVTLTAEDSDGCKASAVGEAPQPAKNRPIDEAALRASLSKLGSTIYELRELRCDLGEGLNVSASAVNALRRQVCDGLDLARQEHFTRLPEFRERDFALAAPRRPERQPLRISAQRAEQLSMIDSCDYDLACVPMEAAGELLREGFDPNKLCAVMPRFTLREAEQARELKALAELGLRHIECTNYAHIRIGREQGLTLHGGFGLNVTNTLALRELGRLGLADCTASFELTAAQINALGGELPFGVMAYGRLPMMLTVNCPIRQSEGCRACRRQLFDRTGRLFPVKCSRERGYVELLNADLLCISDRLRDFGTAAFFGISLFDESPRQAADIVACFKNGRAPETGDRLTKALYYRGVM